MKYLWVGISYKRNRAGVKMDPLDIHSPSGAIVQKIIAHFPNSTHLFDNIINYIPETKQGEKRNITRIDYEDSWESFWIRAIRTNPRYIIIFGIQTLKFAESQKDISINKIERYKLISLRGFRVLFCDHPSYYNIYKRDRVNDFIDTIVTNLTGV